MTSEQEWLEIPAIPSSSVLAKIHRDRSLNAQEELEAAMWGSVKKAEIAH